MCDFRVARVPVSECPVFPWELVEPQGGFHFFHQARVKLFENVDYSQGKGDTWEDLPGTCDETESGEER